MGNRAVFVLGAMLAAGWCAQPCMGQESLAERRLRVENMLPGEKEHLLRCQERFSRLAPDEQNRLRQLNHDLEQNPNAPRLREVMQRYYEWLKTLAPNQRMELSELPPDKRIERIKQILEEQSLQQRDSQETRRAEAIKKAVQQQAKRLGEQLAAQDVGALFDWITQISDRCVPCFLAALPEPRKRIVAQQWENVKDPQRRRLIFAWLWMQWQLANPAKLPPPLSGKDLAALRVKLSKATRERLESKPVSEQWRTVVEWISLLPQERLNSFRAGRLISEETERNLAMFFEHVLTRDEQNRLMAMPSEKMFRELWREYTRAEIANALARPEGQSGTGKRPGAGQAQRGKAGKAAPAAKPAAAATNRPALPARKE